MKKLICNDFAESGAFTVMLRLTGHQCQRVYPSVGPYTQERLDQKYPCDDGGWIHYRVRCEEDFDEVQKLMEVKNER